MSLTLVFTIIQDTVWEQSKSIVVQFAEKPFYQTAKLMEQANKEDNAAHKIDPWSQRGSHTISETKLVIS